MTLRETQKAVDDFINQFEEGYWPPLSMLAALVEETGELAREINDKEGHKKKLVPDNSSLALELGDSLFSLICIANYYHINLDEAFKAVLEKYSQRDTARWTKKSR